MGAARVLEAASWTQAQLGLVTRRPSWLAPAQPAAAPGQVGQTAKGPESTRSPARPSAMPRPRLTSMPPPASTGTRATSEALAVAQAELAQREQELAAMNEELEALRNTSADLAASLATARRRLLEASEGELVKLALGIASRVVGEELASDPTRIVTWAREAIASLPARESMVVAIAKDLAERVPEDAWATATEGAHRLEIDPSLPPGTCEVRAGAATVEVSAAARLDAIGEAIGALS